MILSKHQLYQISEEADELVPSDTYVIHHRS